MFDPHFDCILCGYLMLYHVISCYITVNIYIYIVYHLYIYILYIYIHYFHYYPFIWGIQWLGLRTDASSRPLWPEDVHPHHQKWPKSSPKYGKIWKNMKEFDSF